MITLKKLGCAMALALGVASMVQIDTALAKAKVDAPAVIEKTLTGRSNPKKTGLSNNSLSKLLNKAQDLAEDEKFEEALAQLELALAKAKTPYDIAKTNQIKASYLYNLDRLDDAASAAREAIKADGLDNIEHLQTKFLLAQLLTQAEDYPGSIKAFDDYAADAPKVKGSEYILQAGNYYYSDDFKNAIVFADKAFATGDEPAKSWYQIKLNSFYQGEDYAGAVSYAKELMVKEPDNRQYLSIIVSSYLSEDKNEEALATLIDAKGKGLLDSDSLWRQLYQLYANTEKFELAAGAIEEGIAKGFLKADAKLVNTLGQNYYMAGQDLEEKPGAKPLFEKAIAAFKQAITLDAKDGEAELWLGQLLLLDLDDPKQARIHLAAATGKTLARPGNAYYLLGVAEDQAGNRAAAKAALVKAQGYPESKTNATNYLKNFK